MDDNRVRIKFYSSGDLSLGHNINKALLLLADYDGNAVCTDANDAIEFFNIRYWISTISVIILSSLK